jgi:hypothetical protein
MLLLLDENIGVEIQKMLFEYDTKSIRDMGWLGKKNGELMRLISENDFDIFISTDKNLPYQQNLSKLTYGLWILDTPKNDVNTLKLFVPLIMQEIEKLKGQKPETDLKYIIIEGFSTGKKKRKV